MAIGLVTGRRLGDYVIERELGRGGMSVVYAAEDRRLGRRVALKILSPELSGRKDFRARFLRESRLAASIDHPNVIPIYEAGEAEDGVLFIAMRLVEGTDLRRLLGGDEPLDPARALALVGQAANALDAAHARGLLHRDVKPGNILIARDEAGRDHVYLSDFGLAVPCGGLLGEGSFNGTAEYAAPEQIEGRPEPRSDVYSLACVLFECLAGRPPFRGTRLLATLWSQLNDEAPRLSSVNPELPAAADPVLAAGLAKEPSERPAAAGDLVAQARSALGVDRPAGPRHRFRIAAPILAGTAAIALALFLGLRAQEPGSVSASASPAISTFAGTGEPGSTGDGGPARLARLDEPIDVEVDRAGNLYVADWRGHRVRRIAPDGTITTVVGTGRGGYSGDGGPATEAEIGGVGLAVGPSGDLYLLDVEYPVLRRVDARGIITTVAGTGEVGFLEDAPRTMSPDVCGQPLGLAFDGRGRVHIGCRIANRVVRIERGGLTVVAGTGVPGYSGDGGPATKAALHHPTGIAFDEDDNLYIADSDNNRVRKVDPSGIITTFAGSGGTGLSGDGWRATSVALWQPLSVAIDAAGNVYIAENRTHRVRRVDTNGFITTVAGVGVPGFAGDGGPADQARLDLPTDVAVDLAGNLYIADPGNRRVRKVTP